MGYHKTKIGLGQASPVDRLPPRVALRSSRCLPPSARCQAACACRQERPCGRACRRVPTAVPLREAEDACHRALRSANWQEVPSDRISWEVGAAGPPEGEVLLAVLSRLPVFGRLIDRLRTVTLAAPTGASSPDAELFAVWASGVWASGVWAGGVAGQVIVRISLCGRSAPRRRRPLSEDRAADWRRRSDRLCVSSAGPSTSRVAR